MIQIIAAKTANPKKDTSGLETQVDKRGYELYGLTDEGIKKLEGKG
jgi:hypothetical protein